MDKRKTIVIEFIEFKIETSGIPLKDCADKFSVSIPLFRKVRHNMRGPILSLLYT